MDWIMGINFWGVVHGTKEFLPHLIASGDGHLVNISSLFGLVSMPGQSMYNAAKYAVRGLSEAVREEMLVAGHPVGVTVVHPGGIKTAIARNARYSAKEDGVESAKFFDKNLARMTPERAAEIILKGVRDRQGPGAGRDRRARRAPDGEAARLALPGRRRQPGQEDRADQGRLTRQRLCARGAPGGWRGSAAPGAGRPGAGPASRLSSRCASRSQRLRDVLAEDHARRPARSRPRPR